MKFNKSKKNVTLLAILVVSVITIGVSFAYFAAQVSSPANTNVNIGSEISEKLIFTPGDALNINATQANFAEGAGSISSESTSSATLIANSTAGSANEVYQVYLDVTANDFVYTVDANTPELILTITDPEGNEVTTIEGISYKTVTDVSTSETITGFDITTFKGLIKIKEDEAISTTSSTTGTKEDWTIKVTFVNLSTNQSLNEGKNLDANFILQKDKIKSASETIIDLHGGVDGTNDLYYTNNAEYRYSGKAPNNYVWFNEELWRIIGVFDDNSHGVTDTNLVKIIKDESIGDYMFDNEVDNGGYGYNSWSDDNGGAELNQLLNGYYYNSGIAPNNLAGCDNLNSLGNRLGACDFTSTGLLSEFRNMTEEVTWYLGSDTSNIGTASDVYTAERGNVVSSAPGAHLTYTGKIGLIYPSDYGYAADISSWSKDLFNYWHSDVIDKNWLYSNSSKWLITPSAQESSTIRFFVSTGGVNSNYSFLNFGAVPSVYLKDYVKITNGTGTKSDPYILMY